MKNAMFYLKKNTLQYTLVLRVGSGPGGKEANTDLENLP